LLIHKFKNNNLSYVCKKYKNQHSKEIIINLNLKFKEIVKNMIEEYTKFLNS